MKRDRIADNRTEHNETLEHHVQFEGHGVLIVGKETVGTSKPLCLGLAETGNDVKLIPCFHDAVAPTLAEGWELGAVTVEETLLHNRWMVDGWSLYHRWKR